MIILREAVPEWVHERRAEFKTLRLRLIKIAARIVEKKTRIRVFLTAHCPDADLFRLVSARLTEP